MYLAAKKLVHSSWCAEWHRVTRKPENPSLSFSCPIGPQTQQICDHLTFVSKLLIYKLHYIMFHFFVCISAVFSTENCSCKTDIGGISRLANGHLASNYDCHIRWYLSLVANTAMGNANQKARSFTQMYLFWKMGKCAQQLLIHYSSYFLAHEVSNRSSTFKAQRQYLVTERFPYPLCLQMRIHFSVMLHLFACT